MFVNIRVYKFSEFNLTHINNYMCNMLYYFNNSNPIQQISNKQNNKKRQNITKAIFFNQVLLRCITCFQNKLLLLQLKMPVTYRTTVYHFVFTPGWLYLDSTNKISFLYKTINKQHINTQSQYYNTFTQMRQRQQRSMTSN